MVVWGTMNKHNEISAKSFTAKTLKALAKKNLFIVNSTFIPGADGKYTSGESGFVVSDGRLLNWMGVYNLANS